MSLSFSISTTSGRTGATPPVCRFLHFAFPNSRSVKKTLRWNVFNDRSPRGECEPQSEARSRPGGDGAPKNTATFVAAFFGAPRGLSLALSNSPLDCWPRPGRIAAGRAVLVPVCTEFLISAMLHKRKMPCFSARHFFGAPSAGALRKRSCGAFLATGPREVNASACATHEPAPKGMMHKKSTATFVAVLFGAPFPSKNELSTSSKDTGRPPS